MRIRSTEYIILPLQPELLLFLLLGRGPALAVAELADLPLQGDFLPKQIRAFGFQRRNVFVVFGGQRRIASSPRFGLSLGLGLGLGLSLGFVRG